MLVRFLVEKLAELTGGGTTIDKTDGMDGAKVKDNFKSTSMVEDRTVDLNYLEVGTKLNQLSLKTEVGGFKDDFVSGSPEAYFMPQQFYEQKLSSLKEQYCQIGSEIEKLQSQEEIHWGNAVVEAEEGTEFDNQHSVNFYVKQLNEMMDAESRNLAELESEWNYLKLLEEKRRNLEESLYVANPEAQVKLQKLKEIKLEMQCIITEIREREEEHSKLAEDIKKQPKFASRRSFIERVTEITKNSRKQDADIERIQKETRELQLESNSIQERLLRTYAVVDETVFREAKKDPVARQAYRLLTGIHESFEQISEKIRATDKARREVAEYEAKLVAVLSRSLNMDKLQADLDAIRKENKHLEQHLESS